jgi:acyl-CoA synthetase (AMP-forming)/AMP-acid ligase II
VSTAERFAVEGLARPRGSPAEENQIAVVDGERSVTFGQLDRSADQVANGLAKLGVGPTDRVAFVGRSGLACVELLLGAARAGAVMTIVNWRLHPLELAYVMSDANPAVIVTTVEFAATVAGLAEASTATVLVVGGGDQATDWDAWKEGQSSDPANPPSPSEDDVVLQLYTSGTTGRPKGAMLTRRSLDACIPDTVGVWQLDPTSVMLSVLPVFHIAGAGTVVGSLWARSRLVIDNDPSPENMLRAIEAEGVTNLVLTSVMLQGLVESPATATTDLSSIRTVGYGAAPISAQVLHAAIEALGCRFVQAYGLTETAGVLCILDPEDHWFDPDGPPDTLALAVERLRSCGRPRPGVELRIVDIQTGAPVDPGQPGEVQARTARLMLGYWNKPEATAEVLTTDGWFRTGDVGELDADGYLFLRDRLTDMIISGGENIYPAEVENALQWHPDVAEVAVIGAPHSEWGETPRAAVVRRVGSAVTADELIRFCRDRLAHYKCPTAIDFVDALPRNATGKVLRRQLREPHWAGRERRIN